MYLAGGETLPAIVAQTGGHCGSDRPPQLTVACAACLTAALLRFNGATEQLPLPQVARQAPTDNRWAPQRVNQPGSRPPVENRWCTLCSGNVPTAPPPPPSAMKL